MWQSTTLELSSSVRQHPLWPGMPDLQLVPIAKGDYQLQQDLVMAQGGELQAENTLLVLQNRDIKP